MKKILTLGSVLALAAFARADETTAPVTTPEARANYISVGPAYARFDYKINGVKAGSDDPRNFFGVVFNYGRYFGESSVGVHEFGVQAGVMGASEKNNGVIVAAVEAPLVAVYNYNFKLGDSTRLYVGPRAGVTTLGLAVHDDNTNFRESDTDIAAKFGAGFGIRQQFTQLFGMAVGYEYSRTTDTSFHLSDSGTTYDAKLKDLESHLVVISATWNF